LPGKDEIIEKTILYAMYPAEPRNSISMVFSGFTSFSHIDYRANLATAFLIAYTYNIRTKKKSEFMSLRQNTIETFFRLA